MTVKAKCPYNEPLSLQNWYEKGGWGSAVSNSTYCAYCVANWGGVYKAALILAGALNYLLPSLAGYYLMVSLNRLFQAAPLFSLFIEANRVLLIVVLMVMSYFLYAKVAWIFYLAGLLIALIIQATGFLILEKFCHE